MKQAGRVLRLAAPSFVDNLPEHHRLTAIPLINNALNIADGWNTTVAAIFMDRTLTPEGQAVHAAKATTAALAALDNIDLETKKVTDRLTGLEKALRAKVAAALPKGVDPELLREVRDDLRQLSRAERLNLYRSTTTDPLVLAAIESAPPTLGDRRSDGSRRVEPFVDPEGFATAQMERAEALDPATATTMHELRQLAEVYRLSVNSVRREIAETSAAASSGPFAL